MSLTLNLLSSKTPKKPSKNARALFCLFCFFFFVFSAEIKDYFIPSMTFLSSVSPSILLHKFVLNFGSLVALQHQYTGHYLTHLRCTAKSILLVLCILQEFRDGSLASAGRCTLLTYFPSNINSL